MDQGKDLSMSEGSHGLAIFDSTSQALRAERALKEAGVRLAVIPTPVEFDAGCGIALLIEPVSTGAAGDVLADLDGSRLIEPYYI
jgi:hypothetical protein